MLTLALETSARAGSVALGDESGCLTERALPVREVRSECLLPEIHDLLRASGRTRAEIEAIVVGSGPGSFTGIRIAAALAKGLCFARGLPLFAYSTLEILASGCDRREAVCVLVDVRHGQVAAESFQSVQPLRQKHPAAVLSLPDALTRLGDVRDWTFVGSGARLHEATIRALGGRLAAPAMDAPRAAELLRLVRAEPAHGRVSDVQGWEPRYVRPAVSGPDG